MTTQDRPVDTAEVKQNHWGKPGEECHGDEYDCPYYWPCPTWQVADALEDVRAEVSELRSELERIADHTRDAYDQRDAARAALERMREPYRVQPASGSMRPMSDPYGRSADA